MQEREQFDEASTPEHPRSLSNWLRQKLFPTPPLAEPPTMSAPSTIEPPTLPLPHQHLPGFNCNQNFHHQNWLTPPTMIPLNVPLETPEAQISRSTRFSENLYPLHPPHLNAKDRAPLQQGNNTLKKLRSQESCSSHSQKISPSHQKTLSPGRQLPLQTLKRSILPLPPLPLNPLIPLHPLTSPQPPSTRDAKWMNHPGSRWGQFGHSFEQTPRPPLKSTPPL